MATLQLLGTEAIAPATGGAQAVAFSPDGRLLAVANNITPFAPNLDGCVSLFPIERSGVPTRWHLGTPVQLPTGASGVGYAGGLAFSAKAGLMATANCIDQSISLFTSLDHPGIYTPVPGSPFHLASKASENKPAYGYDPNALAFGPEEIRSGGIVPRGSRPRIGSTPCRSSPRARWDWRRRACRIRPTSSASRPRWARPASRSVTCARSTSTIRS